MAAATDEEIDTSILAFLKNEPSPKKVNEVATHLSIAKKEANKRLYELEKRNKVTRDNSARWAVVYGDANVKDDQGTSASENADTALVPVNCTALCERRLSTVSVVATNQMTEIEQQILKVLKEHKGQISTLEIAKSVGKKTAKDVNCSLYSLKSKGLLFHHAQNKQWSMKGTEGISYSAGPVINNFFFQNNPTNIINQQGESNAVNISDSQNTQIGNYNTISSNENSGYLPSPKGSTLGKAPAYPAPDVGSPLPEAMNSHMPKQEVNILKSSLHNSMIGNNNIMLVNCESEESKRREESNMQYKTWPRQNSVYDTDSTSDEDGSSSANGDTNYTKTSPEQNVSIRDSTIRNTVIANDTKATIDDGFKGDISWIISQAHRLRLENCEQMANFSPVTSSGISIADSQVTNANIGNDNKMTIKEIGSEEDTSDSEEGGQEEEMVNESRH
ncbi:Z-DNA-binding protein 1 isoform X3 [Ambystoma mexicanum]|uniref:Z-DNA-binding protein 1 isoform X3 n=1 Tax=Ambystoma mexicanum TaxID=8296 RepID=UPI0037E8D32B